MTAIQYGNAIRATEQEAQRFNQVMLEVLLNPDKIIQISVDKKTGKATQELADGETVEVTNSKGFTDRIECTDTFALIEHRSFSCLVFNGSKSGKPDRGLQIGIEDVNVLGQERLGRFYVGDIDGNGINDIAIKAKDGAIYVFHGQQSA